MSILSNRAPIALVVLAAAAAALLAAPAAQAQPPKARIAHLNREMRQLRANLRAEKAAHAATISLLKTTQAQLAASQSQAASLAAAAATLRATLTQRTSERDAARSQAASLQARLAAIPTPFQAAVEQVRREVEWAEHGPAIGEAQPAQAGTSPGALTAYAAMNYVEGHVSMAAYGYLGQPVLPLTADGVLGAQAGMCGHAALTFAAILEHFGYRVRSVQFYWTMPGYGPVGHIAVEVYYDGGWHYFDPFFGAFWRDGAGNVLSIDAVRAGQGSEVRNVASFTNLVEDPWYGGDWIGFETDPATVVAIGQQAFN